MGQYFAYNYSGAPFVILGPTHLAALAALLLLNLALIRFRGSPEGTRRTVRWVLAIAIWAAELSWNLWVFLNGYWTVQWMLPLQLCNVLVWLAGFMLIFKNRTIYEFEYFLGIGGAIQYLATPDIGIYGFPHFRFFQAFLSHGLLLTIPIYMTVVEGFRPSWKSILRVAVVANVYMVIIYLVNLSLGSNYLMINGKPDTPSLLTILPPWPYYIIFMELIGVVTCLLLYLPFAVRDRRALARARDE